MEKVGNSVVASLDGRDDRLYPFLPFLLQDLWEIGSSPDEIINLIRRSSLGAGSELRVIDLGCGKGIISVNLARELGFRCHGIDAMPEFIDEARRWATKMGVSHLCRFEVGDIRQKVDGCSGYDLAVLGSIGRVLGSIEETLSRVKQCLKPGGHIILDDGFIVDTSDFNHPACESYSETMRQIHSSGLTVVDDSIIAAEVIQTSDQHIFEQIHKRVDELIESQPENRQLLEGYLQAQQEENHALEHEITCATWLLQHTPK
jgi:2-polyprenyl-3-methyl-5-hydroxy-6-metoxy-1,4-benzoquinol methylase